MPKKLYRCCPYCKQPLPYVQQIDESELPNNKKKEVTEK